MVDGPSTGWRSLRDVPEPRQVATATLTQVDALLTRIKTQSGPGSQSARKTLLGELFGAVTRQEQSFLQRLLTAQAIAVACFIVFPLRISFARPQTTGEFGLLFDALGMLDMPFNQAPSLHIATTTILFDLYSRTLPRWTLPATILWSLLVGASVLTTYQHHFIDVPTGFLLGLLCVWMWPPEGGNRLANSLRVASRFSK